MGKCDRLKWNRKKLGMTQEELAKKIGVSQKTISTLETDETAWVTMRDSTTDAIQDILSKLGSWQCDINAVFKDNASDIDIRDMRKRIREKREELNLSQRDLAMMLGLNQATICHYEKHDKYWKQSNSLVISKLVNFVEGKYDPEPNTNKKEKVRKETKNTEVTTNVVSVKTPLVNEVEPVEDTLNNIIDILQDRMKKAKAVGNKTDVYVHMIAGLCEEYLRGV